VNAQSDTSKLRMIWQLMAGQRLLYGAAILALVFASCFLYLVPLIPQAVMDGVLSDDPQEISALSRRLIELGGGRSYVRDHLVWSALAMVLLTGAAGIFTYLRGRWSAMASEAIACRVRDLLFDQLQHLPCRYHDRAETGDQVQRCTSDVETLRRFLASQVVEIGRAAFMMLVPIPLMLALDVRMTLVSLVTIPPIVVFSLVFFRRVRISFKKVDEAEGRMTSTLQENLTGIRVVRAFARQDHEMEKFDDRNATHRNLHYRLFKIMAGYWSLSDLLCMGQKALVVAAGGYWLATGRMQVGTFYFFLAAVNMFIWPVRMMGRILTDLGKAMVAIGRIGEILHHPRESEPVEAAELAAIPGAGSEIVFDRVTFTHGGEGRVLDELSLRAEPGQTVALLGPSGSGKSTIANLLLRFYDPDEGAIRIDGVDIGTLRRQSVRSMIAVVMQEPFLYSKTLKENIRLGRKSAVEPEIIEAAATACVHDAIEEFDQGYDTLVGERGVTLSGGQRQRVALARALLDEPSILVLDDALSAVDTDTEAAILDALRQHGHSCTRIVIAHRLSTLMHADQILVLDQGRVIQRGTHEELAREDGLYRRLWTIQTALEEDLGRDIEDTIEVPIE